VRATGPGPDRVTLRRPFGVSAGTVGLVLAWLGGLAIVQLTGAVAVLILLAAGVVATVAAAVAGWSALGTVQVGSPRLPTLVTQGEEFPIEVPVTSRRPVWVEVRRGAENVAAGWSDGERFTSTASTAGRGRFESLEVRVRSAGPAGLVWWTRQASLPVATVDVAARIDPGRAQVETTSLVAEGERAGRAGAIAGEIDGVRPWRDGDSDKWVHWASTLRSGELIVHDRRRGADERWLVRARFGLPEPDIEAGVVRNALEAGLRRGAVVSVAVGDGEPMPITSSDEAARWSATAELGPPTRPPSSAPWWRPGAAEPDVRSTARARWWAAGATFLSLIMLAGVLGAGPLTYVLITGGVFVGALVSARSLVSGAPPSGLARGVVGAGSLVALLFVAASSGRLDGLLAFLSGPLPQVLIVLVVLHGLECRDRRSVRVALGVSAVVVMYAAAFRVDDGLVWWLIAWVIVFTVALTTLADVPTASPRRFTARGITAVVVGIAATLGLLALVPTPTGPAVLALPSLLKNERDAPVPGAVVGPDGEVRTDGSATSDGDRSPAGQPGGYVGFSETMDTSVRGELGDEVVMRVRAPEPAFWRGQTFSRFDGRRWYADDDIGTLRSGPIVDIPSSLGNIGLAPDVEVDQFVQTFYFEQDMPNVVFHAERPVRIFIESDVYVRPDGAIRAATTLPDGAVYTVVSSRPRVDADRLRSQGHVGRRLTPVGRQALADYLEVPASTSAETVALAEQLASGATSTYDVIAAYERWFAANVEYDLSAPLPDPGEDAVHEFLFGSRRGFCEQIASALTVMLRSQGVPARLATGYVPGTRDRITGVFEVKASEAHAWVEVWFPETGWQPFDPTAVVPLSADARAGSVGAELLGGLSDVTARHGSRLLAIAFGLLAAAGGAWLLVVLRRRRRRGRWGVLQDRFTAAAARRGAAAGAPNPELARTWPDESRPRADEAAASLDRAAFDPTFVDDDEDYRRVRELVGSLPGRAAPR
jgi:transglutaminase-like putative cysteine protease